MTAEEIRLEALRLAKAGHDWRDADYIIKAADKLAAFITSGTVPPEPPAIPETPTQDTVD